MITGFGKVKQKSIICEFVYLAFLVTLFLTMDLQAAQKPLLIGLNADMSSGSANSGLAIKRGVLIALHEINNAKGVLNRTLKLEILNHRGIPARGKANLKNFAANPDIVAVLGGLHTPVMMAEKKALFDTGIIRLPYLTPWAAGTPIVDNPWIFRLSVRDEYAGPFLIDKALDRGYQKIALLLERTAWGRSNERSMKSALEKKGLKPIIVQWFPWKTERNRIAQKLEKIYQTQAEVILLVANTPEGATIVEAMSDRDKNSRLPIISHWGITGGDFTLRVGHRLKAIDLSFLQTYSFLRHPQTSRNQNVVFLARKLFNEQVRDPQDLFSPAGTAHAYDLVHILALALEKAKSTDRGKIRDALESLGKYKGLVRTYDPPFRAGQGKKHDALDRSDFNLSSYKFNSSMNRWLIIPEK